MIVMAPSLRGEFSLIITLVQEGISWLEDKGLDPLQAIVLVE